MMDKTQTFIKQCEKAEEIQGIFLDKLKSPMGWEYNHIAVIWNRKDIKGLMGTLLTREPLYGMSWEDGRYFIYNGKIRGEHCKYLLSEEDPEASVVWLPRQEQLQAMVGNLTLSGCRNWGEYAYYFGLWCRVEADKDNFTSMEQLWLAFVMKEKYGKLWDGENWVKTK